jgi:DNA polymerase-1
MQSQTSKAPLTLDQAKEAYENFMNAFPELKKWLEQQGDQSVQQGYITGLNGRIRDLRPVFHNKGKTWKTIGEAKRYANNTPIQGTSSDVLLGVAREIFYKFIEEGLQSLVINMVHDSIVFDIHPNEVEDVARIVQWAFVEAFQKSPLKNVKRIAEILPIKGELFIANNWLEAEDKESDDEGNPYHNPKFVYQCSSHMEI